jgi:predicted transcriptional regulator
MSRLTITVSDEIHRALKETAARTGRTIGSIIEEGLRLRGIRSMASAKDLVAKARAGADLTEADALALALDETHQSRQQ